MRLSSFGSFHVGGRPVRVRDRPVETVFLSRDLPEYPFDPNGDFWIEQAYVQYFIPENRRFATPVLFQHGGGLTGACWETTPDGRPGWIPQFVEAGFAVYVIDNVERGRAGWCALEGEWSGHAIIRPAEEAWTLFRIGRPDDYGSRTPHDGQRFPVEAFDAFVKQFVPRWPGNSEAQARALEAALEAVGEAAIVCHSQGGDLVHRDLLLLSGRAPAVVSLEPSGVPDVGLDRRFPALPRMLYLMGDYLDSEPTWAALAPRIRRWAEFSGGDYRELPGHSHMMMMDRGCEETADLVIGWLADRLPRA